jgi:hypothetical protein
VLVDGRAHGHDLGAIGAQLGDADLPTTASAFNFSASSRMWSRQFSRASKTKRFAADAPD